MLKKIQKIVFKYLKNMKTCAPTGATVIGFKCYRGQLVLGSTVFHRYNVSSPKVYKTVIFREPGIFAPPPILISFYNKCVALEIPLFIPLQVSI